MSWVDSLRTTLLISLSLLAVYLLARRFKQMVLAKDLPVVLHAELLALQVMYHPDRLRIEVKVPRTEALFPAMLSHDHTRIMSWPSTGPLQGTHTLELALDQHPAGDYYLELGTGSQRTVRKFTLKRT